MTVNLPEENKALVLKAFDTLFNKRDYAMAETFWSDKYIQHSAHIPPGREGLFNLIKGMPPKLRYEPGLVVAQGEFVILHGRFSGFGAPANWIVADIVRVRDGNLIEHWDVIQDEAQRNNQRVATRCSETPSPRNWMKFKYLGAMSSQARHSAEGKFFLDTRGPSSDP